MASQRCVVAAVDFSEISPAVVETALRIARRLGQGLLVVHELGDLAGVKEDGPILPALRHWLDETRQQARDTLDQLLTDLGLVAASDVTSAVVESDAGLCWPTGEGGEQAPVVVIGASRPGFHPDSFCSSIVKRCASPVLISRRPAPTGYRHLLVGLDLSPQAQRAWDFALDLAEPDAVVTACYIQEAHNREIAPEAVEAWARARARGCRVNVRVESGSPRSALLGAAQTEGADLVAVGRSGHGILHDLLLGSTAQAIAQKAPCDVLVVGIEDGPKP